MRAELGFDRISLYGDSYGTYLGQSYAFRHGDRLAALILDSAYPVRGESPWYPSLWRNGIRALQIACDRKAACKGNANRRLRRMVGLLRRTPRGVGPLLDAIASGGYEPPLRNFLRIDQAISAYLHGDRRPYKRLTAADPGPYGIYRAYSRGDELAVSCNDYPMLWSKEAGPSARRRQLHAEVRGYPKRAFAPFTPREIALESVAGLHRVPRLAEAEPVLRAAGAARRPAAGDADPGDLRRARQRHQPGRGQGGRPRLRRRPPAGRPQRRPRALALRRALPGPPLGPALRRRTRVAGPSATPPARRGAATAR